MARVHYWQYIVDSEGRPMENITVRFYLNDNPAEEAEIFTHPSIGTPVTSTESDLKTNGNGYFEFWVGDEFETLGGYVSTQKFRITWERAGILLGQINNIDIFPPVFQVDETDTTTSTRTDKNKLVSNALAYTWEQHATAVLGANAHGFEAVDTTSQDTVYNKLVSNNLMNYIISAITSAGTLSITASGAIERQFTVTSWTTDGDNYYADILHGIGHGHPIIQVMEVATDRVVMPTRVTQVDNNTLRLHMATNTDMNVIIVG
jgi:hypothetical protein